MTKHRTKVIMIKAMINYGIIYYKIELIWMYEKILSYAPNQYVEKFVEELNLISENMN